eukprot:jgi/Ulvmu1/9809/UM056_0049.1
MLDREVVTDTAAESMPATDPDRESVTEPFLPQALIAPSGRGAEPGTDVSRLPRRIPLKLEPKAWFANERTFLAWATMSLAFAGTSAALTALTTHRHQDFRVKGPISPATVATISIMLGPSSLGMLWYGFFVYMHRNKSMANKSVGLYDDRIGPVIMASLVAAILLGMTCITYYSYFTSSF